MEMVSLDSPGLRTDLSRRLGSDHLSDGRKVFPVATDGCEDGGKLKGQIVRQTQTRLVDARLCVFISPTGWLLCAAVSQPVLLPLTILQREN